MMVGYDLLYSAHDLAALATAAMLRLNSSQ